MSFHAGPAAVVGGWTTVAYQEGRWSHCDVWFHGPVGYLARTWRLLGRNGGVWAVLATGDIGSIPLLAPNAGERTGLAASIRGWPCDAFLMEVANGAALAPAEWQMYCWGREAAPSAVAGSGALPSVVVPAPELRTDSGAPAGAAVITGAILLYVNRSSAYQITADEYRKELREREKERVARKSGSRR